MNYLVENVDDRFIRLGEEEFRQSVKDRKGGEHINVSGVSDPQDNILDWGGGTPDIGNPDETMEKYKEMLKQNAGKKDKDGFTYDENGIRGQSFEEGTIWKGQNGDTATYMERDGSKEIKTYVDKDAKIKASMKKWTPYKKK